MAHRRAGKEWKYLSQGSQRYQVGYPSRVRGWVRTHLVAPSAWNAVIRGAKYWIMFPSSDDDPAPPGVFVSDDDAEVTSPLSIAEWLLTFHSEARRTRGCLEGICQAGEVLHVPSGRISVGSQSDLYARKIARTSLYHVHPGMIVSSSSSFVVVPAQGAKLGNPSLKREVS